MRPLPRRLTDHLPFMLAMRQIAFLGGNCATLPLRQGRSAIEGAFLERGMVRFRHLVEAAGVPAGD